MDREIRELLVRIETDLGLVKAWSEVDDKGLAAHGAVAYGGAGKSWQFFLIGSPSGAAVGSAVRLPPKGPGVPCMNKDPHVVNLTPELAAKAYKIAAAAVKDKG